MNRTSTGAMFLSAVALVGIVMQESYTSQAIIPVPGDVPTIGFGTTSGVKLGDKITPPKALARALSDVQSYEGALKKCVKVPLHQYEYDALVDHAYNTGPTAFCNSTIVKRLNQQDYAGACAAILDWHMYKGFDCRTPGNKVCYGLWLRRIKDNKKCLGTS